jgi:outer membrane protein OmpA-like peptidoglycan-associated protein
MKARFVASMLALAAIAAPALADELSTSVMRPTSVDPASGRIVGQLPGGQGSKSYYVALELARGDLIAQLQVAGSPNTGKRVDFELLDADARVMGSVYAMASLDPIGEALKTFPIDHAGRYVARLVADGKESGSFCVLLGGTALASANASGCPARMVAAIVPPPVAPEHPPAAPPPAAKPLAANPLAGKPVEVIHSACEDRLRVGSDVLFDFDRAEVRGEAEPALAELTRLIAAANRTAMIEGHTDAIGTDGYNQGLSERRALAVRSALAHRGLALAQLNVHGFGKSRPVAPNEHPDGSDDPDGRQRNRRVEVVINTCS